MLRRRYSAAVVGICGETQKLRMKGGTRKREEAVRKIRKYAGVFAKALFPREVFTSASFPVRIFLRLYFFGRLLKISAAIREKTSDAVMPAADAVSGPVLSLIHI